MKNTFLFITIVLIVFAVFIGYEKNKVGKELASAMNVWRAIAFQARSDGVTAEEFYTRYEHLGDIVSDKGMPGPTLVQRVRSSGRLCTEFSISVFYSSRGDASSYLMMIGGERHGKYCFF